MVMAIDHDDVGERPPQRLGGFQPAETGADDHHFGTAFGHGVSSGQRNGSGNVPLYRPRLPSARRPFSNPRL